MMSMVALTRSSTSFSRSFTSAPTTSRASMASPAWPSRALASSFRRTWRRWKTMHPEPHGDVGGVLDGVGHVVELESGHGAAYRRPEGPANYCKRL